MTKADIINSISRKTGLSKEEVAPCVEAIMSIIKDCLAKDEDVFLRGFGTFHNKVRKEKKARNITAATEVIVPEHTIPHFKPCKAFMQTIAKKQGK